MKDIMGLALAGEPQPKGSLRAIPMRKKDGSVAVGMKNDNPKTKEWQDLISFHAKGEMRGQPAYEGPICVNCFFRLTRPKSHYMKGFMLREGFSVEMIEKPDLDKLVRCVLDALTGIAYVDDSQVVTLAGTKEYAHPPHVAGVTILVRGVDP